MATAVHSIAGVDLSDPGTFHGRDLVSMWRGVRAENPVHWHPVEGRQVPGFWVISRYHDVMNV